MAKLILIADDDEMMRAMLRATFEGAGYRVEEASDGAEATEKMRKLKPELLILDIFMPNQDGFETLRELDTTVPIFVISGTNRGFGTASHLLTASHMGARRTFAKPFDPNELLEAAKEALAAP